MEGNLSGETRSQFNEELLFSYRTIDKTAETVRKQLNEKGNSSIENEARTVFQEYVNYLSPFLPKVHGAVLLEDNEINEIKTQEATPIKTSIGTLFKNRIFISYPTRVYFLPDTQEIVSYRVHDVNEFPQEGRAFKGFEDYRKYNPDNFFKIVEAQSYKYMEINRFSTSEIMENVKEIEEKIPKDSNIDREKLEAGRERLEKQLKGFEGEISRVESEAVKPIKNRISQLINLLISRNKFDKDAIIFLSDTGEKDNKGREIAEYFLIGEIGIVSSPKIPRLKKKVISNLEILDKVEDNDYKFITGAGYVSKLLIEGITGINVNYLEQQDRKKGYGL